MSGFWDVVGWGSGWFTQWMNSDMVFRDNKSIYFGDGKDARLYWDGSNFYIDTTSGGVYLQDQVYAATHLHFGDNDKLYMGGSDDVEMYFDATDFVLDATAGSIKFDSTDEIEVMFSGDVLLKIDEAKVADYTAAADTSATDIYFRAQSGGAHTSNNPSGGDIRMVPGELGSGGSGTAGVFAIEDPSSTDAITFYHDGTRGYCASTAGIRFTSHVTLDDNINLYFGDGLDWRLQNDTANPANHLELLEGSVPALCFYGSTTIGQGFAASSATAGNSLYQATQTGGASTTGNGLAGGSLYFEMGAGSDAFASEGGDGGAGGDFVVVPGAGGALDGGGANGAAGRFKVKDPGSADTIEMYHDGSSGYMGTSSGNLGINVAGSLTYIAKATAFYSQLTAGTVDLGDTGHEWRGLYLGEDASSGAYFGLDQDARLYYDESSTDKLRLSGKGLTFETSLDSAAVADEVTLGRYDIGAGNTVLAISQETAVAADTDETKFSNKLQVRINGSTYYIMLTTT